MPDGVIIPGGPSFSGSPQPPDVPCDPTGEGWRGPTGPQGPPGAIGGLTGGTLTGPLNWIATGSTALRSAQDRSADVANVLDFGADPTGATESSAAFNAACATNKGSVYAPAGTYKLSNPVTVGPSTTVSQELYGDGWGTVLSVGPDFSSSANGVILLGRSYGLANIVRHAIRNLQIQFKQPPDFVTTTTAATAIHGTTLTVANTSGIVVGQYVWDNTSPNAIVDSGFNFFPQVQSIAGNVVTLTQGTQGTVASGDSIGFGANRSQFMPLSSSPTLAPGTGGVRYPWAIYANLSHNLLIDKVMIGGAWNGVYIRNNTWTIGELFFGGYSVGLDIDQCYNFPSLSVYQSHIGFSASGGTATQCAYYDGSTIAANLGNTPGWYECIQAWCSKVVLTSAWNGGHFGNLEMDGNHADFIANGSSQGITTTQISMFYSTKGQGEGANSAIIINGPPVVIDMISMTYAGSSNAILVQSGGLVLRGGYLWNGTNAVHSMIYQMGGSLDISGMRFDANSGRTDIYIRSDAGTFRMQNSNFIVAPGAGATGLVMTDSTFSCVLNVNFNGWGFTQPGPAGLYAYLVSGSLLSLNNLAPGTTVGSAGIAGEIDINGPSSSSRLLRFQTAGLSSWALTTSNTGSEDLWINRYDSSGNFVNSSLTINKTTGAVGMGIVTLAQLNVSATTGPNIRAGTGAASGAQPKGSIWMRTDGAAGSTMYVSQGGGIWNAVAGV